MNEAVIREKLAELCDAIVKSPQGPNGRKAHSNAGTYLDQTGVGPNSVDDALDTLRLQVKYLVFDIEATRRENRYLRQMLESRPKRPGGESSGE